MPKRALIEHRPWLLAAIAGAILYYFVEDNPIGGTWLMLLKGTGVGFLAIYALRRAPGVDGKILFAALATCATADMVLELDFIIGGALFAAAHLIALTLYLRNRREQTTPSQKLFAIVLLIAVPAISYLLSNRLDIAAYGAIIGMMTAAAWMSRFPRYRVGIGAVIFVVSDWLIFSRFGLYDLTPAPDYLIWPLYIGGQVMIATGVVQSLRGERPVK